MTGPAFIARTLADAEAALAAAAAAGSGLTLVSAENAAAYAGAGYFKALVAAAAAAHPGVPVAAFLDCGDSPGQVLAALREGLRGAIFAGPAAVTAKLDAIAQQLGARLLTERPAAIDLEALRRGRDWQETLRRAFAGGSALG